jgi:uncharacterized membrane protein
LPPRPDRPPDGLRSAWPDGDAARGKRHFSPFGPDSFGRRAERAARFFGTPQYILGQSVVVVLWIVLNSVALVQHWDPYPFILLNLAFSTQAAYAAPLILLAQTRQADRDKQAAEILERHHDQVATRAEKQQESLERTASELKQLLEANTDLTQQDKDLTEQVATLTREIHARLGTVS